MGGETIGETYGPAMAVTDQGEADAVFAALVAGHLAVRPQDGAAEAGRVQRQNLGYYAGYYDHDTRRRVERLFRCCHPVFGPAGDEPLPPEDAFAIGVAAGRRLREGGSI